jgi:hypothetical protein
MHTFLKDSDESYSVGYWLTNPDGFIWNKVFHGLSFASAVRAVNALNGGEVLLKASLDVLERCQ